MNTRGLHIIAILVTLMMVGETSGQDPGLQDSLIIGNLNGSVIPAALNQEIILPVWIKTDDSLTFFHTPLASDNDYIVLRLGGDLFEPLSLWDEISFLQPNSNSPSPGFTSQSILGFAYLFDPRDPQNFLYTDYQWWHVADYHMLTTDDSSALGDTICLIEGFNPANGGLLWGIPDGVTQIIPAAKYPCIYFTENAPPEFTEPGPGEEFNVNSEFSIRIPVEATDADGDLMSMAVDFPADSVLFDSVAVSPGYSSYLFAWTPSVEDTGQFIATFTADDNHGGAVNLDVIINAMPSILQVEEVNSFPCMNVSVPLNLINLGESSYIGGFEILLQYGIPEMIELINVERAPRIDNWEYFHVNLGDSSTIRLTGLANVVGNGNTLPPGEGPVAFLNFEVSSDSVYLGQYAEINFIKWDENDNTVSDSTGYLLVHPDVDSGWVFNQDPGSVLVGDINLNEIAWEISDAVLLSNHIIRPDDFPFNNVQIIASDTNRDSVSATVPDLVYLINVVNGIIIPPRAGPNDDISAAIVADIVDNQNNIIVYRYESPIPSGGILMRLNHGQDEIKSLSTSTGMNLLSSDVNGVLSVMLFDYDGGVISPGENILEIEIPGQSVPSITELQISDRYGYFIPAEEGFNSAIPREFTLRGTYPNPFNSTVSIRFTLPKISDVELSIYDVLGRIVRTCRREDMPAGECHIDWDGTNDNGGKVSSGIYLYRIDAGDFEATSRMTLLK
jgi:hypothetical protein